MASRHPSYNRGAALLKQSDVAAERLIAVLRMVLAAALFCGVGVLLLRLDTAGLSIRRVELMFLLAGAACYFLLGAVNFHFSHPQRFQFWHSWVFNALEVCLLAGQLYIDVRDPMTPSLLALASPVLLVVALVLSIQALRYRLELHMFTALLLIATCAVVTFHNPRLAVPWGADVIAEMQVLYSPPPNVMRFVMLVTLAVVIGTAVFRARRLVIRVAREVEDADNLRRFLPAELRDDLSNEALERLRTPERKQVAIAMIDLRGFTELTDTLPAAQVAEILLWFRGLVLDAAERHGGVVDKFIGDGAMMIFGLNGGAQQAAAAALAAFDDICTGLDARNRQGGGTAKDEDGGGAPKIAIASGLHCGPALIGAFGDARRLEFTALGTSVNIASRLEAIAKDHDMRLVVSAHALQMAQTGGHQSPQGFAPLGTVSIRGIAEPVEVLGRT